MQPSVTSPPLLRIAAAQINPTLGNLAANTGLILAALEDARRQNAHVLVTPELAICGYPPEDLLLRPDFLAACDNALAELETRIQALGDISLIVGHPALLDGKRYNSASVLRPGQKTATYRKMLLPNQEVFDEYRYFSPGKTPLVVEIGGIACGLLICEDVWEETPARLARAAGAQTLIALNASPYHPGKPRERARELAQRARENDCPALYVNLVGGQDELLFDGGSFALDRSGDTLARLPQFREGLLITEYRDKNLSARAKNNALPAIANVIAPELSAEAEIWDALVLGLRDYVEKNRFPGVILGLSGGIDSALTLALAVDALGAEKVRAVMMPSPYTAQMSLDDSRAMTRQLGVRYDEISIEPVMRVFSTLLAPQFAECAGQPAGVVEENIQARARGMILMAISNQTGALVLTTGNKSEMAVGYCTLYGDMAGGFAVIKDVPKTLVYRLARYRNQREAGSASAFLPIPENIITRPPSAELKPGQTDQDSLPPYEILDAIVEGYMEENKSLAELIASGLSSADITKVVRLIHLAEYKRRQSPVGLRITTRGFGKDWRYPITNRYFPPS